MRLAVYARSFCRHAGLGAALLSTLTNLVSPPWTIHLQPGFQRDRQSGRDARVELLTLGAVQRAGQRRVFTGA